jgi:uncharacterized membrane protein YccC
MASAAPADPRQQRALRLACGTALSLALSFGLALPLPFIAPMLTAIMLVSMSQALPLKAAIALPLLVMITTGSGLLLIPLLSHAPVSGVLLVGLGLFLCFRYGQRGGNNLLATFMVIGLTMISAAGTTSFALGVEVVEALAKGLLIAVLMVVGSHWLFPEPSTTVPSAAKPSNPLDSNWLALRGALVVLPAYLLALINPAGYMPLIMQAVNLGQQAGSVRARHAARELLGSTLLGGLLAILLWSGLSIFPHLWLFFLWTLLFSLLLARKLYALSQTNLPPSFWLNVLTTLLLLLGQSVQDSASGKDVVSAFSVRMALFIAVTLYACAAIYLIDRYRQRHLPIPAAN